MCRKYMMVINIQKYSTYVLNLTFESTTGAAVKCYDQGYKSSHPAIPTYELRCPPRKIIRGLHRKETLENFSK